MKAITQISRICSDGIETSETDVALVTDEQVCQRAVTAYDADVPPDGLVRERALYVIRLGSDYLAVDPTQKFGQWFTGIVLNAAFERKSWGDSAYSCTNAYRSG